MNLEEFKNNIKTCLLEKDINYSLSSVSFLRNDKNIYVATLKYNKGEWPEPTMLNFLQLRKKCQSITIPNRIYVNTCILENEDGISMLQIWFK